MGRIRHTLRRARGHRELRDLAREQSRTRRNETTRDHERQARLEREAAPLGAITVDDASVAAALAEFDRVWDALPPRDQARAVAALVAALRWSLGRGFDHLPSRGRPVVGMRGGL